MGEEATQPERGRSWDGIVRREIDVEFRVINDEERSVEVVASSEALDSHGDILKQFWDLSRYEKNPVVLWNHNVFESSPYSFGGAIRPEDLMPIGKAENVKVQGKKLVAKLVLLKASPEEEPFVDKLWRRIQQGVQRAVSVGFRPGEVRRILKLDGGTDHFELGSAEHPNELREISFVPMGSNPEAVAKSIAWERDHLGRLVADAAERGPEHEEEAMTDEEKKALEQAKADADKLRAELATEKQKAADAEALATKNATDRDGLQKQLDAEKAMTSKLEKDLADERKAHEEAKTAVAKTELDARQNKKFTPAEREELDALVKDLGIARVTKLLDARPDITLTQNVEVDGKGVGNNQPAPPPVDGSGTSATDDLVAQANKAAAAPVTH